MQLQLTLSLRLLLQLGGITHIAGRHAGRDAGMPSIVCGQQRRSIEIEMMLMLMLMMLCLRLLLLAFQILQAQLQCAAIVVVDATCWRQRCSYCGQRSQQRTEQRKLQLQEKDREGERERERVC